jgi:hypothetical protein
VFNNKYDGVPQFVLTLNDGQLGTFVM